MQNKIGLPAVDDLMRGGIVPGELNVFYSESGTGKSIFNEVPQLTRASAYSAHCSTTIEHDVNGKLCYYDEAMDIINALQDQIKFCQKVILNNSNNSIIGDTNE